MTWGVAYCYPKQIKGLTPISHLLHQYRGLPLQRPATVFLFSKTDAATEMTALSRTTLFSSDCANNSDRSKSARPSTVNVAPISKFSTGEIVAIPPLPFALKLRNM